MNKQEFKAHSRSNLKIIIDTREQLPYLFDNFSAQTVVKGLKTGDYSIDGEEENVACERKSLPDLIGCVTKNRKRFEKELMRLSMMILKAVVVEGSMGQIAGKEYRGRVKPSGVLGSIAFWQVKYNVPFLFCSTRELAEITVYNLLKNYNRKNR